MSYSSLPTYYFGLVSSPSSNQVIKNISEFATPLGTNIPILKMPEEGENHYSLALDVTGVNKQDIALDIRENHLIVEVEKEFDPYKVAKNSWDKAYGIYTRVFNIPKNVDQKKVKYQVRGNILEVTMAKVKTAPLGKERNERSRPSSLQAP